MWTGGPIDWVIVAALYAVPIVLFRRLGGWGSASRAIQGWGRHASARRAARLRLARVPAPPDA